MEFSLSVTATHTNHHDMALANRLAGESSNKSSTIQKSAAVIQDAMQSHCQQEMNMHHTYDYADTNICRQHTNTVFKRPRNCEKDHPFLASKPGKCTIHKHFQKTILCSGWVDHSLKTPALNMLYVRNGRAKNAKNAKGMPFSKYGISCLTTFSCIHNPEF